MTITVQGLAYYPVKGCGAVPVDRAEITGTGLVHDRTFMVVDAEDGAFRSQRTNPAMAAIRAEVLDGGAVLALAVPGLEPLELDVDRDGPRRAVSMFDRPLGEACDQGDSVAEWFSEALGAKSRLVRVAPGFDRDGWGETPARSPSPTPMRCWSPPPRRWPASTPVSRPAATRPAYRWTASARTSSCPVPTSRTSRTGYAG